MLVAVYQELLKAQAFAIALIRETGERSAPPTSDPLGDADLPMLLDSERRYNERLAYWQSVADLTGMA